MVNLAIRLVIKRG